jgi:hypothetical protein
VPEVEELKASWLQGKRPAELEEEEEAAAGAAGEEVVAAAGEPEEGLQTAALLPRAVVWRS